MHNWTTVYLRQRNLKPEVSEDVDMFHELRLWMSCVSLTQYFAHLLTLYKCYTNLLCLLGRPRVHVDCIFLTLQENIFWGSERPTNLFYVSEISDFVACLPYYVPYGIILLLYSGQHIFHQFRQKPFFCPHFQQPFFLTLVAITFFVVFTSSRPPDI